MDGLKITAACLERDELEKIVTKLGQLGLIEIDFENGKIVILDDLEKMVKEYDELKESAASLAIEDKDWQLI